MQVVRRSFTRSGRGLWQLAIGVLPACGLLACTAHLPSNPGMAGQAAAAGNHEQRLQALEAGMQQLAQQLDAVQATVAGARAVGRVGDTQPEEYRPVRPTLVLAAHPQRRVPLAPPQYEPESMPVMTPPTRVPDTLPVVSPQRERPVAPAPQNTAVAPAPPQRQGDWVINLASYKNQSYAARKQAEFADKGVMVEQVRAEVGGKTIYRLCVPGFASSRAASTEATAIRTRLGLSDSWIARH